VRSFSVSPFRFVSEDPVIPPPPKDLKADEYPAAPEYSPDLLNKEERSMYDMMAPDQRAAFDAANRRLVADFNDIEKRAAMFADIDKKVNQIDKEEDLRFEDIRPRSRGFWAEDDPDELAQVEDGDEEINDDEITSMAHAEMELHREVREYARIAAWDMPMLSSEFASRPFYVLQHLTEDFSCRAGQTLHPSPRNTYPALPLYYIHGRAAPG
jgi:small subunit ribosomal protein S35